MKIYEDMYSNQYTEKELEIVMGEDKTISEEIFFYFMELLTLDNFIDAFLAMPEYFKNKVYEHATEAWKTENNIRMICDIDIDENTLLENRRMGDRVIDVD